MKGASDFFSYLLGFALGLAFFFFLILPALPEELTGRLYVIDGDTIWHYASPGAPPEKIRLLDIDAPETRNSACENELSMGLLAKARLQWLVLFHKPVRIERCAEHGQPCHDRFGRTLARLHSPEGEVGAILLREKLALKYEPGRKAERNAHWCGSGP